MKPTIKPIFIHIPKTAGVSIQRITMGHSRCLHIKASKYSKSDRQNAFVFSFARNPYDRLVSSFFYLKEGGMHEKDKAYGESLPNTFKKFVNSDFDLTWMHFRPMMSWLDRKIDFIGRFENLQEDFNIVCDKIGIPQQQIPHNNKSNHKHYTEYYDDETRQIVAEKYAKDIEYFGYKFGE